jgi:hypothetical protein
MARIIKIAGQNETIRRSHDETLVDLATIGITNCVAVIIKDEKGNASLTHVDAHTDLNFINLEAALIKDNYTIYIIKDESHKGNLVEKIDKFIEENLNDKVRKLFNSKKVIKVDTKSVILRGQAVTKRRISDFYELLFNKAPNKDNPFRNDKIELGNKDIQTRIFEHTITGYLRPLSRRMPDIVYSNKKWKETKEYFTLPDDIRHETEELKKYRNDIHMLNKSLVNLMKKVTQQNFDNGLLIDKDNLQLMPITEYTQRFSSYLIMYWNTQDKIANKADPIAPHTISKLEYFNNSTDSLSGENNKNRKRIIKIAAQNETIRKSLDETNVALATLYLINSVAIILQDNLGNASLTHVDSNTDLSFIDDEVKFMKDPYNIQIIKSFNHTSTLGDRVRRTLTRKFKAKVSNEIKETETGCVLLSDKTIDFPPYIDFEELFNNKTPSSNNSLKNDKIEIGSKKLSLRTFEHTITSYLRPLNERKPVVVYYDKKWIGKDKYYTLPADIKTDLDHLKKYSKNNEQLAKEIKELISKIAGPGLKAEGIYLATKNILIPIEQYITNLPPLLHSFWEYEEGERVKKLIEERFNVKLGKVEVIDNEKFDEVDISNEQQKNNIIKVIKLAAPNETVRITSDETNVALATIGLGQNVAVVIKERFGNASLTYVDSYTDLSFIDSEVKAMCEFRIDVIESKESDKKLVTHVKKYIQENFKRKNPKRKPTQIISETDCILVEGKEFSYPKIDEFYEHIDNNAINDSNKLKNYKVETGNKDLQIRFFERAIAHYFRPLAKKTLPNVVYSNGKWEDEDRYFALPGNTAKSIEGLKKYQSNSSQLLAKINKALFSITAEHTSSLNSSFKLLDILLKYWEHKDSISENKNNPSTFLIGNTAAKVEIIKDNLSVG